MSTLTTTVVAPAHRATPRGAHLIGRLVDAFNAYRRVHAAQRKLLARAKEAEAVRQLARDLEGVDPGFASDLYAAADRHYKWG